ncbi:MULTISPECIES: ArsR/SmtB family transcription factor [unclassified Sphingobium]|jgi:DNA-binding transcriptional ArsR family regulator|uniref:ArsR/SmtB family transcription factor n=1 Tax=unclassified Sphingobium TaxID=2611147 RepID=UPI0007F49C0A|nr:MULTISPECIES: metalloregulator ArsR/SmtB family transcription factor [unclassified Sphingobium]OAN57522.1 transcriptional regulator [Sphingobium sp. TCM1]WIW89078.1 metalloregulator ArsR/SmtB family transcription factor [Sphingobium sp. V4]
MSRAEPAQLFAALGDATRLGLVGRLADGGERSIVQLGEGLPMSRQAVAKHLEVLHGAGLVHRRRSGREVHYALRRDAIEAARGWLAEVSAQWDGTLARLKLFVEEGDG